MQVMTMEQVESVSGAMTENQCIGMSMFGGALIGGAVGAWGTAGIGTFNGMSFGMAAGGMFGMMFCNRS